MRHDAIYAFLFNHVNVYVLYGTLWEKRLSVAAEAVSWRMRTNGRRCVVRGRVPVARRLSRGHIKYRILWHQKTRSRHSNCANSTPPDTDLHVDVTNNPFISPNR